MQLARRSLEISQAGAVRRFGVGGLAQFVDPGQQFRGFGIEFDGAIVAHQTRGFFVALSVRPALLLLQLAQCCENAGLRFGGQNAEAGACLVHHLADGFTRAGFAEARCGQAPREGKGEAKQCSLWRAHGDPFGTSAQDVT